MKISELIPILEKVKTGFGDVELMVQGTGMDHDTAYAVKSMSLRNVTETVIKAKNTKRGKSITYQSIVLVPDDCVPLLETKIDEEQDHHE